MKFKYIYICICFVSNKVLLKVRSELEHNVNSALYKYVLLLLLL